MSPYIWLGVLVVLLVALTVMRMNKSKKMQAEQTNFIDTLKVGDEVVTHFGVYGKIVAIYETTVGRVFTIESGEKHKTELDISYSMIAGLDQKQKVKFDEQGNMYSLDGKLIQTKPVEKNKVGKIEDKNKVEKIEEPTKEETAVEVQTESIVDNPIVEKKKTKKPAAKQNKTSK